MVDPVEEQINFIIDEIDATISGKYPFKLRDIYEHPLDYKERPTLMAEIEKLKGDVADYFSKRKEEVSDATKLYMDEATKASKVADKIDEEISTAAKSAKKAVIKPLTFTRKEDEDEIIFVDTYDDASYSKAIDALVGSALFVVDSSLEIDNFKVGRWVFPDASGKNRAIFVSFPINPSGALDIARDQMVMALDAVKSEILIQLSVEGKPLPMMPKPAASAPVGRAAPTAKK